MVDDILHEVDALAAGGGAAGAADSKEKDGSTWGDEDEKGAGAGAGAAAEPPIVVEWKHEEFEAARKEVRRRMDLSSCLALLDSAVATKSLSKLTEAINKVLPPSVSLWLSISV